MDSSEDLGLVTNVPQYCLVNKTTKDTVIDRLFPHELADYIERGYDVVSYSELYDYREWLIKKNQQRLAKNLAKKLRRNRGSKE